MQISVVIPTCNRKKRLLSLLQNLDRSSYPLTEVIIIDSGDEKPSPEEFSIFSNLCVQYLQSERSVCIQRNIGIKMARSAWILLCDDDIEIPDNYLRELINHIRTHPDAGAVSGLWMEKEKDNWIATHPVNSSRELVWKYLFKTGLWGEIICKDNIITTRIKRYYHQKGNHISKAGWPVNTNFTGEYVVCPVYSLGASLVKKDWLLASPFDEVLDAHGIGDNYGVAIDFPTRGIHVVTGIQVYHHKEAINRLKQPLQHYRRILALDYFIRIKKDLPAKRRWLAWSLIGNLINFTLRGNGPMIRSCIKSIRKVVWGDNPFYQASKKGEKVIEPDL